MDKTFAVTGPRALTQQQTQQAKSDLARLTGHCHAGDALGLDTLAHQAAISSTRYDKNPALPHRAQGAERSTRMLRAARAAGCTVLHAWPNKPAPLGLKPAKSWPNGANGSGTWGTIAMAVGLGMRVELHPLADVGELPEWLQQTPQEAQQLTLI